MWVDESGGTADTTDTTGATDELTVTMEGEEYAVDTTIDLNEDGVLDTGVVETDDGALAFTDTDGDGTADMGATLDSQGNVVSMAEFDDATGQWHEMDDPGAAPSTPGTDAGSDGGMTADLPQGDVSVGPATTDTDGDGVLDTAVVQDEAGNTITFTDVDGDGAADKAIVIDQQGNATTLEHTGDGEWTETGTSGLAAATGGADSDALWGEGEGRTPVEGVAKIDSETGRWMSPN